MKIECILKNIGALGVDHAIKTENLMALSRLNNRELRQAIENERKAGALICSKTGTGGGYFLATSIVDVTTYVRQQENRIKSQETALLPFREIIRKAGENEYIF